MSNTQQEKTKPKANTTEDETWPKEPKGTPKQSHHTTESQTQPNTGQDFVEGKFSAKVRLK